MSKYLINMDDGHLEFRNDVTDKHINLKPISDAVAKMIIDGEVESKDVIAAINLRLRDEGAFDDMESYMAEKAKLNVRRSNRQKDDRGNKLPDRSDEEVSLDEIRAVSNKEEKRETRHKRIEKVASALDFANK